MAKVLTAVAIAILVTVIVLALLAGLGYGSKYFKEHQNDDLADKAVSKMVPATFTQKEFPRAYIVWWTKYCVSEQQAEKFSKFTDDQIVDYCACFADNAVQKFTMKEQQAAAQVRWDSKIVPESLKKYTDIKTECTQKTLQ